MFTDDDNPGTQEGSENLGAAADDAATDPNAPPPDDGEAGATEEEQAAAKAKADAEELERLRTERPLYLKRLEREKQLEAELAAERRARLEAAERTNGTHAPTKPTGIGDYRKAARIEELRKQAASDDLNAVDAAIVVEAYDKGARAERNSEIAKYPAEDQENLEKIMLHEGCSARGAAAILKGLKAQYAEEEAARERAEKAAANGAIVAEGERRVKASEVKPKPASTSVRPVGAGEVKSITKLTWAQFARKMDVLDPNSKEARDLNARSEPDYKGKDRIELVPE